MIRLAAVLFLAVMTMGHGPAEWIERDSYKNAAGELCCGERDCGYFKSGHIEHVDGGYEVDADFQVEIADRQTVMHVKGFVPNTEATPSPTGEYWACVWGGKLKCFFVPPPGS